MIFPVLSTSVAFVPREKVMRLSSGGVRKSRYSEAPGNGPPPPKPLIRPLAPLHRPETLRYRPVPRARPETPLYSPDDTLRPYYHRTG